MSFLLLAAAVFLAVFAAVTSLASLPAWILTLRAGHGGEDPVTLARLLFGLRVLPSLAGIAAACAALTSFFLFEPRGLPEAPGMTLLALTLLGALWLLAGARRTARDLWLAFRLTRRWTREGRPATLPGAPAPVYVIRHAFPLVSLIGVLRSRLFVAQQVLDSLSAPEMEAVLSHEGSHLRRRDNLRRVAIRFAPALPWPSAARALEERWEQAVEEVCDAHAHDTLEMAAALLKTARLATSGERIEIPAVTVHRGGSIARRVRLLVDGAGSGSVRSPGRGRPRAWTFAAAGALICLPLLLPSVQSLVELLVNLP